MTRPLFLSAVTLIAVGACLWCGCSNSETFDLEAAGTPNECSCSADGFVVTLINPQLTEDQLVILCRLERVLLKEPIVVNGVLEGEAITLRFSKRYVDNKILATELQYWDANDELLPSGGLQMRSLEEAFLNGKQDRTEFLLHAVVPKGAKWFALTIPSLCFECPRIALPGQ